MIQSDQDGAFVNALYDQLARDCLAVAASEEGRVPRLTITVGPHVEHGTVKGARLTIQSFGSVFEVDIAPGTPVTQIERKLRRCAEQPAT
ncbi:hypothetical protein [Paludisphaera rhizosphaerae]|uniref:hypothetical protein n=1 Tax=Paludisphaera rhizosphaerae TaxID=2711216 RepID=UPI0013EAF914|nr:hypothetical protein [Paludisphaera rhizosphaerae]